MSSPYAHYALCEECGAPAGTTCMGLDDRPAIEVCDDRILKVPEELYPQSQRGVDTQRIGTSRSVINRRRAGTIKQPVYAPCNHCGASTRLYGGAIAYGHTWCPMPLCRLAYKQAKSSRSEAQRRPHCKATKK